MDTKELLEFEDFVRNENDETISSEIASERFDYIERSTDFFPYIRESWIVSRAMSLLLFYGEKSGRYEDAISFMKSKYADYCELCKYDYQWKAQINFTWAILLEKLNRHYEALEHTKEGVLMQFVDNTSYEGWEFLSFRGCTKYVFSEIADEEISLMHPDEFNDPMDTVLLQWLKNQKDSATDTLGETLAQNNIDALKNLRVRCFSRTHRLPDGEDFASMQKLRAHKTQDVRKINPLMWAHYADNHKGICIKYRFKSDFFKLLNDEENELFRIGNVEYKRSLNINDFGISLKDALFAKSKVWSYENEVRLVYYSTKDTPKVKTVKVPGAIEAIYLGLRCSAADERIIKALVKDRNIPIYKMYTDINDAYRLKFKKV